MVETRGRELEGDETESELLFKKRKSSASHSLIIPRTHSVKKYIDINLIVCNDDSTASGL